MILTMATLDSSALVNLTNRVERMTEVRGAMADTQKNLGLFFACRLNHKNNKKPDIQKD